VKQLGFHGNNAQSWAQEPSTKSPHDNDGRKIISNTHGLKLRDRAIDPRYFAHCAISNEARQRMVRVFISGFEAPRMSDSVTNIPRISRVTKAQASVGQSDKGHEHVDVVSVTHILQHQEFAIRARTL
jgi:hypothetical protein